MGFLLLPSSKGSSYIQDISPLLNICDVNIFSWPMAYLSFIKDIFPRTGVFNFDRDRCGLNSVYIKIYILKL